jgi:hypothetical protein
MEPATVLFHILAKNKEAVLEYWLDQNIDRLDYPKNKIILFFRTNNNTDNTKNILSDWIKKQPKDQWNSIYFDDSDVPENIEQYDIHEWNTVRLKVISQLRNEGLAKSLDVGADFYFSCDVDNFLMPDTLSILVREDVPVIAPLLRYAMSDRSKTSTNKYVNEYYSNFHHPVTPDGYFMDSPIYYEILRQATPGLHEIDLVHCTYLVSKDAVAKSSYVDGTTAYDYVIFARTLRGNNIPQVFDTRRIYGCLTLEEDAEACRAYMSSLDTNSS